jgi:PadR family transcriptional regulator, regulatory protein PadR
VGECDRRNGEIQGHVHAGGRPCCRRAGGGGGGALVEPAALAALLGGGAHGYDVRREISELTGGALEVDAGGLYRVLRRLETDGFVVSRWEEGDSGPQRRDYEITAEGRELAEDWLAHLRERERVSKLLADVLSSALEARQP